MRLSKCGYYADLVVYPIVVLALTLVSFRSPHSRFFGVFFLCSLSGIAGWTFVEYAMHRFVLHLIRAAAQMHDMHHASPAAFVGTPSWLSLAAFGLGAFIPLWTIAGLEVASGAVTGLMMGYVWYLVVHDAVHRWRLNRGSMLYRARLRHAYHHHHVDQRDGNFGVTTGLWDRLLGTAIDYSPGQKTKRLG